MYWMSSVVIIVVLALGASAVSLLLIWSSLGKEALVGYLVLGLAGILGLWSALEAAESTRASVLVSPIFGENAGVLSGAAADLGRVIVGWVRVITFVSVTLLVLAAGALLFRQPAAVEREKEQLALRGARLQTLLYMSAVILIVGLIEYRALYTWAADAATLNNMATGAQIIKLADAALASTGAVYAVGLAAFYLPVLLILRARARRLQSQVPSEGSNSAWLQELNLGFTVSKALGTMITVLSPLLAQAPIAALLKLIQV
jgi:hypothetical protein